MQLALHYSEFILFHGFITYTTGITLAKCDLSVLSSNVYLLTNPLLLVEIAFSTG